MESGGASVISGGLPTQARDRASVVRWLQGRASGHLRATVLLRRLKSLRATSDSLLKHQRCGVWVLVIPTSAACESEETSGLEAHYNHSSYVALTP